VKKIMTRTEEQVEKTIKLYDDGNTVMTRKEIANTVGLTEPIIRDIIKEHNTKEHPERIKEQNEFVKKKLSEILTHEGHDEESTIKSIFNLQRIAEKSGRNLKEFVDDNEIIYDRIYRFTNETVKVFDFFIDIALNMSLTFESFDIQEFLKMVDDYRTRNQYLNELEETIKEKETMKEETEDFIKNTIIPNLDVYIKKKETLEKEITKHIKNVDKLIEKEDIIDKKLQEHQSFEEKLQKALHDNEELKKYIYNLNTEYKKLATEYKNTHKTLQEITKNSEQTYKEHSILKIAFERISKAYPEEILGIIGEIGNEYQQSQ